MDDQIMHDEAQHEFYLIRGGNKALLAYTIRDGGIIDFTRTFVPPELRGGSIAARLAAAGLDFAVASGYRIVPSCSFIRTYISKYPRYRDHLYKHP